MSNLKNYSGRELKSAEDAAIDLSLEDTEEQKTKRSEEQEQKDKEEGEEGEGGKKTGSGGKAIPEAELEPFCVWLKDSLGANRVTEIRLTSRLSDSPAIITDHENGAVRRMMKMVVRYSEGEGV